MPSTRTYSKSGSPDATLNMRWKTPSSAQRQSWRNTLFQASDPVGRSRHGPPTRTFQTTASKSRRLFLAVATRLRDVPGNRGSINSHLRSVIKKRSRRMPPPKRKFESHSATYGNRYSPRGQVTKLSFINDTYAIRASGKSNTLPRSSELPSADEQTVSPQSAWRVINEI